MKMEHLLAKHQRPVGLAGGATNAALERDLVRHVRWMAIGYASLFVLLTVFLIGFGIVTVNDVRNGRAVGTGILTAAGVTFPLLMELLRRTVREWARADLMVVLSRRLDASQLQVIVDHLLKT
jgi:hypothetical protein